MLRLKRLLFLAPAGFALAGVLSQVPARADQPAPRGIALPAPDPLAHSLSVVAMLGRKMFYDPALSGSGRMSCASCHDPANHFAPDNARAVQIGGAHLASPGIRAVPSLTYRIFTPAFTFGPPNPSEELNEASPMAVSQQGAAAKGVTTVAGPATTAKPLKTAGTTTLAAPVPRGGLFWDGRADTLEDQTFGVLMSPFEMANTSRAALAATIRARYGKRLAMLFGKGVMTDDDLIISEAGFALGRYQREDPAFHPFSSKFDAVLAGKATFTPAEAAGKKLFDDPKKGNCAACHLDSSETPGVPPLFTDFEYEALGVPRNPAIPANADPGYHDLGLCGPLRDDAIARNPANCGLFKTPSLRNVASRKVFFHNGVYHDLKQVVDFYVKRDTDPAAIYPMRNGKLNRYDDLPKRYRGNIDYLDAPFGLATLGQKPALTPAEEDDIVAFLKTLTDGYTPAKTQ
ncbi:cytochrome-c peroxidase [Acidimangrovimonas sediminis]|uniref:cytochrome-c peroxidase n=1 Tax=Acidimangrovimonas sediminis TaxID=2056283 RepID=UPI000C7FCCA3|nr:cytochrome c peroxidase [Acidimangrovimonas sediminis]